jgi:O-antigen ligase/Tfp pilus assembly protein PilF
MATAAGVPLREPANDGWAAAVLAVMIFLAPAVGVPGEEMLQDTLKSIVVSFGALVAALLFLLAQRRRREPLRWHAVLWLPLLLMAYALGSMAWSHAYLAGVEAVRWFVFTVIAWVALNTLGREQLGGLARAIHAGALVASAWAFAQFWGGLELFPQGPQPASTFINRNFFAEFAACTLPFALLMLARARDAQIAVVLAVSNGLVLTAILMTGTRAALMAMWLQLLLVLPVMAWGCRGQLAWSAWTPKLRVIVACALAGTVLVLGAIPTSNPKILEEGHGSTALQRGLQRTQSIGPKDYSLGVRMVMWRATLQAIKAKPVTGLGAGAWESEIPRYQAEGSQLETDYYVHNEFLQLVAEYGVVGWIFLLLLAALLVAAAWRTWRDTSPEADLERPWRATLLLALMVVSNIGFPWRMAATGALFALCLGALAASDARLGYVGRAFAQPLRWSGAVARGAIAATLACIALALFITERAAESERKLVSAAKMALTITASGDWNNPRFDDMKRELLQLTREGIAINPHYRKITPMVADELARWGDWRDATWIWESVLASRPYIVAITTNVARGYASMGRNDLALAYLQRARRIQPRAPSVRSLEVILLARSGDETRALQLAKEALAEGISDYDLVNTAFLLAYRAHDYPLARKLIAERTERWPESRARGLLQQARIAEELNDKAQALAYGRQALAAASPAERPLFVNELPAAVRAELAASAPQTSASSR